MNPVPGAVPATAGPSTQQPVSGVAASSRVSFERVHVGNKSFVSTGASVTRDLENLDIIPLGTTTSPSLHVSKIK